MKPRDERCYLNKESSLQGVVSEKESSLHSRYVEVRKSAGLTVKKFKRQSW